MKDLGDMPFPDQMALLIKTIKEIKKLLEGFDSCTEAPLKSGIIPFLRAELYERRLVMQWGIDVIDAELMPIIKEGMYASCYEQALYDSNIQNELKDYLGMTTGIRLRKKK